MNLTTNKQLGYQEMRNVIIEFSLVKESNKVTDFEIIKEISKALSEENTIPWCDKVEKISLNKANGKQVMQSRKVLVQ